MRTLKTIAKLAASLLLFALVLRTVDLQVVWRLLAHLRVALLCAGILVLLLQVFVLAWRWKMVTEILGHGLAGGAVLRITFVGQFFNQALPSGVGGDAVRIWMARRAGLALRQAVHGVVGDRAVATAMLLAIILASFEFQPSVLGSATTRWIADLLALGLLGGFVLCLAIAPLLQAWGVRMRAVREAIELAVAVREIVSGRRAAGVLLLSAANHPLSILSMLLLARALHVATDWTAFVVLVPMVLLLAMVPVSIGGWGLREGIMVAAFAHVGVSRETALSLSVIYGLAGIVVSLPGGVLWALGRQSGLDGARRWQFARRASAGAALETAP